MGKRFRNISIEDFRGIADGERQRKGRWKTRLFTYIVIGGICFIAGFSWDIKLFKDTFLDKKKKIAKIEADNYNLQKKLDSLESISLQKEVEVFGDAFYYFEDGNKKYYISK